VRDCLSEGVTFGIPPYRNEAVSMLGTEMQLVGVEKSYDSGELDIRTRAVGLFRIEEFYRQAPGKLYAGGLVEEVADDNAADIVLQARITAHMEQLYDVLGLRKLMQDLPADYRVYDVAHHLGLNTEQEFQLLEAETEAERQELVLDHLEHILPVLLETERLKERVRLNGHFKNLTPPNF
jgi:ATP-dependent Lon protease